jgi:hypothetical protein
MYDKVTDDRRRTIGSPCITIGEVEALTIVFRSGRLVSHSRAGAQDIIVSVNGLDEMRNVYRTSHLWAVLEMTLLLHLLQLIFKTSCISSNTPFSYLVSRKQ